MTTPIATTLNSQPDHVIVKDLLYLPKASVSLNDIKKLKADNMVVDPFTKQITHLYVDTADYFGVPLYAVAGLKKSQCRVVDQRASGSPISFQTKSTLRDGQVSLVAEFQRVLNLGGTGFVIKAPTAWGKTRVGIELVKIVGKTALIIVHNSSLLLQWKERFLQHTDLTEDDIGIMGDGKVVVEGRKVVIGLVHTASKPHVIEQYKQYFGFILFDEVDRSVPPETYAAAAASYCPRIRVGVSATHKRQDLKHVLFQKYLQQTLLVGRFEKNHVKVQQRVIVHNYPLTSGFIYPGAKTTVFKGLLCSNLAANDQRNRLIASYLISSYNTGRKSLVLSDRTVQLSYVKDILVASGVPEEHIAFHADQVTLSSGVKIKISKDERRRAIEEAPITLGTYRSMEAGTDIPTLAMLIMATPMKEVEQTKGRNERPAEKSTPLLVDIVDTYYPTAAAWFKERAALYTAEGLECKVVAAPERRMEKPKPELWRK